MYHSRQYSKIQSTLKSTLFLKLPKLRNCETVIGNPRKYSLEPGVSTLYINNVMTLLLLLFMIHETNNKNIN